MTSPETELISALESGLRAAADPSLAPGMEAYMKSSIPYLGVRVPAVRALVRTTVRLHPLANTAALEATVRALWDGAEYREERYLATELLNCPTTRKLQSLELLPLYEHMIVTGAWWDHVDELSHRVGDLLALDRERMEAVLRGWATGADPWLRRSSIIAQLGAKAATDTDLLSYAIEASIAEPGFFLRKAIGWALRDYARTDPGWVRAFVASHPELSPLSTREALKRL